LEHRFSNQSETDSKLISPSIADQTRPSNHSASKLPSRRPRPVSADAAWRRHSDHNTDSLVMLRGCYFHRHLPSSRRSPPRYRQGFPQEPSLHLDPRRRNSPARPSRRGGCDGAVRNELRGSGVRSARAFRGTASASHAPHAKQQGGVARDSEGRDASRGWADRPISPSRYPMIPSLRGRAAQGTPPFGGGAWNLVRPASGLAIFFVAGDCVLALNVGCDALRANHHSLSI
jgi:hypothetical protein